MKAKLALVGRPEGARQNRIGPQNTQNTQKRKKPIPMAMVRVASQNV